MSLRRVADFFGVRVDDLWGEHLGVPARPRRDRSLVKWTGSKRLQAPQIVAHFPRKIATYHEPFLGSGAVLFELLGSDIGVKRFRCSDTCAPLIGIWEMVRCEPDVLLKRYEEMWAEVRRGGAKFYYEVRASFNRSQDPIQFFFILRTCRNGLVRFNKKGPFTTGFHHGRSGVEPREVHALLQGWTQRLAGRDIRFEVKDYREVRSRPGDLLFVDPPYDVPDPEIYSGVIDIDMLFDWLGRQRGGYVVTLNGFVGGEDRRLAVPPHLYDEHLQLEGRGNPLVPGGDRRVTDALYLKLDGRSSLARHRHEA
ncbi:MAG TPA: DNA adenine methylase [Fimbriiglobus sp.]|nr:DNA adenine methylase [Fimbriiglobus sp.]